VSVLASAGFDGADGAESLDDAKRPSVQVVTRMRRSDSSKRAWRCSTMDWSSESRTRGAGIVCATSETAPAARGMT